MIGDIFRQEREKRQITLKDVENETNIRILYLEAIEKGNYGVIRGEVYLRGFIKSYAKFLGLDYKEILDKYYDERGISRTLAEVPTDEPAVQPAADTAAVKSDQKVSQTQSNNFHRRIEDHKQKRITVNVIFAVIIAFIVIGCAAYFIVPLFTATKPSSPVQPAASQQTTQQKQAQQADSKPTVAHVELAFTDTCWVQVKVDGKTVLEKTVDKNSYFQWEGKQNVEVTVGNAGVAKAKLNGKDIGSLGNKGSVVTKIFTKDKVEDVKK